MRTFTAIFTTTESGSVEHERYVCQDDYSANQPLSTYGSPYLGEYETSEDWREALANYAREHIGNVWSVGGCHGWKLQYVDEACATYVFTLDFDTANPAQ